MLCLALNSRTFILSRLSFIVESGIGGCELHELSIRDLSIDAPILRKFIDDRNGSVSALGV